MKILGFERLWIWGVLIWRLSSYMRGQTLDIGPVCLLLKFDMKMHYAKTHGRQFTESKIWEFVYNVDFGTVLIRWLSPNLGGRDIWYHSPWTGAISGVLTAVHCSGTCFTFLYNVCTLPYYYLQGSIDFNIANTNFPSRGIYFLIPRDWLLYKEWLTALQGASYLQP